MKTIKGELLIFISAMGFGVMPVLAKFAYRAGSDVGQVLLVRFIFASVMLWVYVLAAGRNYRIGKSCVVYLAVSALLGYCTTAVFTYTAFKYISAGLADLLMFLYPTLIVLVKFLIYKEKMPVLCILALILSMVGMGLIVWTPDMHYNVVGITAGILSAFSYCFYVMSLGSDKIKDIDGIVITTYIVTFCTAGMFFYALFSSGGQIIPAYGSIIYILLISLLSTVVPILLFCLGVKDIGPSKAAIISTVEPAFATIFGAVMLGEAISLFTIIGGILILTGVILLQPRRQRIENQ